MVFAAIGRCCVRYRWLVVALWLVAALAGLAVLPSIGSVAQGDTGAFLPADAPSRRASALAAPLQAAGLRTVPVLVARLDGGLVAGDQAPIEALAAAVRGVPGVQVVRDAGRSGDGTAEELVVGAKVAGTGPAAAAQKALVDRLRAAIGGVPLPAGLQVHLAGALATSVDNNSQAGRTGGAVQNLSLLFVIVLLVIVFRSVLAPLVTVLPAFLVVRLAGGLVAEAARGGLAVSSVAQLLLIVLVLGAGTDYGLFLVFRVREEIGRGRDTGPAVVEAVTRVGESIAFSAGTVIAALLSLLAASFRLYADLAAPLAIGVGLMLLAGLTLLPALLAILGPAVFWPARPGPGRSGTGWWGRATAGLLRRPVRTLVVGLVIFTGLAVAAAGYQASGFGGPAQPPAGSDSAAGQALLTGHFPGTVGNPTGVVFRLARPAWDDPAPLATAQRELAADPVFSAVGGPLSGNGTALSAEQLRRLHTTLGPAGALPPTEPAGLDVPARQYQAYRASANYLSADGRTVQFATLLSAGDPGATAGLRAVPAVRAVAGRVAGDIGASGYGVVGQGATLYDISTISAGDLRTVIPIAVLVIALLLALVMRSLVAPLYLIASVVLSYFAALGLTVLLFVTVAGLTGLTFILPFLMFIFLLALGEDYNILVMTRIREEAHRWPLPEAVRRAVGVTGSTVTSAGLVLAGSFAVLAIAGNKGANGGEALGVGGGLALGILMDTFLVRTLLVPTVVVLLGRWNWWPSRLRPVAEPVDALADPDAT